MFVFGRLMTSTMAYLLQLNGQFHGNIASAHEKLISKVRNLFLLSVCVLTILLLLLLLFCFVVVCVESLATAALFQRVQGSRRWRRAQAQTERRRTTIATATAATAAAAAAAAAATAKDACAYNDAYFKR